MRLSLRAGPQRAQTAKSASLPAPVGGLNAFNALADMPTKDALRLDNWFPKPDSVELRRGSTNHVTGFTSPVETLMSFNQASGVPRMFAASGQFIYDVTGIGAVSSPVQSALTSARWQHINFSNSAGGQFLYMVNGSDLPRYWDGSAWVIPGLTGISNAADLINIASHKNRLWFVRKNSFEAYYLNTNAITGGLSKFDVASLFKLGGRLVAIATVTSSSGLTVDDYFAMISSEGEVAVYRGTDPSSASTWALVGMFRIGRPIGYRCVQRKGTDVLVITADGITALQEMMRSDVVSQDQQVTRKIQNAVNQQVQLYSDLFGWQIILCPIQNQFIVNVPTSETMSMQFVQNTVTDAWCTFSGWNAKCLELHGDDVYFGTQTAVIRANSGFNDLGSNIVGDARQAFNYLGNRAQQKFISMIRPVYSVTLNVSTLIDINMDFAVNDPGQSVVAAGEELGALWGSGIWDVSIWSGTQIVQNDWLEVGDTGYCVSPVIKVATGISNVSWYSTDIVYSLGGIL